MPSFHPDDHLPSAQIESRILTSYLLHPAPLPTVLPLQDFTTLFPRKQQAHPQIRSLYHDLQFQRNLDMENVRANIDREVDRGPGMRRKLQQDYLREMQDADGSKLSTTEGMTKKRKRTSRQYNNNNEPISVTPEPEGDPTDIPLDLAFSSHQSLTNLPTHTHTSTNHTLASLLAAMTRAISDLQTETRTYESESNELWEQMQDTIGGLSDLRYGRFGDRGDGQRIEEEIEEGLKRLKRVCESRSGDT